MAEFRGQIHCYAKVHGCCMDQVLRSVCMHNRGCANTYAPCTVTFSGQGRTVSGPSALRKPGISISAGEDPPRPQAKFANLPTGVVLTLNLTPLPSKAPAVPAAAPTTKPLSRPHAPMHIIHSRPVCCRGGSSAPTGQIHKPTNQRGAHPQHGAARALACGAGGSCCRSRQSQAGGFGGGWPARGLRAGGFDADRVLHCHHCRAQGPGKLLLKCLGLGSLCSRLWIT